MKSAAVIVAASAALVSGQVTYNATTGQYTCALPGGNYCAGSSLGTNIIIRCNNGIGQPGNCNDNLDGEPPVGDFPTLCWQTSDTSGDAACEKNCVVYANPSFTLASSICVPTYTASTSSTAPPATSTSAPPTVSTTVSVSTSPCPTSSSPVITLSTTVGPTGGNSTYTPTTTKSPVGPTTTKSPGTVVTAGATANQVGGAIAFVGLAAAYFL